MYANSNPVRYVDPLGLYSCLTDEQWAPELVGLCLLLDSSAEARDLFYRYGILTGLGVVGWRDAEVFFDHWLNGNGETMYFGSRLVDLIERDTASLIARSRREYLRHAAQSMRGSGGRMPPDHRRDFLSNSDPEFIPDNYAAELYPVSTELFIALGGVWFERDYWGTVKEGGSGRYHISLKTGFFVSKYWSFRPNTEMFPGLPLNEVPETPPAEFNLADRIGVPGWLPRPVLVRSPAWASLEALLEASPLVGHIPISTGHPWGIYIPDEWGYAMEQDGSANPFMAQGWWTREESFFAIDHACDGWDYGDIVDGPEVTFEMLPLNVDPSPNATYLHSGRK
jgi:hypothetical protein